MTRKVQFAAFAVAFSLVASACSDQADPTSVNDAGVAGVTTAADARGGGVVHHVSAGSNDACSSARDLPNGCDGNFSLTAREKADGSVEGQWQDTFAGGGNGIHVAIDCLNVIGNAAIVSGVITHGTNGVGDDISGQQAVALVVDNGTSANDPADQISFSNFSSIAAPEWCDRLTQASFASQTWDLTTGQVSVR